MREVKNTSRSLTKNGLLSRARRPPSLNLEEVVTADDRFMRAVGSSAFTKRKRFRILQRRIRSQLEGGEVRERDDRPFRGKSGSSRCLARTSFDLSERGVMSHDSNPPRQSSRDMLAFSTGCEHPKRANMLLQAHNKPFLLRPVNMGKQAFNEAPLRRLAALFAEVFSRHSVLSTRNKHLWTTIKLQTVSRWI
jgi:hypothetical protein